MKAIETRGDTASVNGFRKARFHTIFKDTLQGNEVWWLSGWGSSGLYFYNTDTKTVTRIKLRDGDKPLPSYPLRGIAKDSFGRIWVGTEGGGIIMIDDYLTFSHRVFKNIADDSTSLPNNLIRDLCKDKEGNIWTITTGRGIAKMTFTENRQPRFRTYSRNFGLQHLALYDALVDNNNNIWLSSSAGIEKFSIATSRFTHYGYDSGIFYSQFATGKYIDDEGYFYLSSWFTFVRFHPDSFKHGLAPPAIRITHLQIMNRDSSTLLPRENVQLHYLQNFLSFNLEAVNLLDPYETRFRYQLEGVDKDWVDVGSRNYASYPDLPSGKYIFRFTACNNEGTWNENPATFSFTILPPWWRTTWAYASYGVLLIASLYSLRRYEKKRDRLKQEAELERIESEKRVQQAFSKQLLEAQEEERSRLAGELHDSLVQNLLIAKNRSLIAQKKLTDPETVGKDLGDISSVLDEAIEEVRKIAHNLRPYQLDRLGVTRALQALVKKVDEASTMRFHAELDNVDPYFTAETGIILFRIVQEGITNILKHSGATEANIVMKVKEKIIELTIADNGKGMPSYSPETQTSGFGLSGIEQRCRMLQGSCDVVSAPSKGTMLTVQIPVEL